jgi:hypothetical protein
MTTTFLNNLLIQQNILLVTLVLYLDSKKENNGFIFYGRLLWQFLNARETSNQIILTESPVKTSFPKTTWSRVSDRNLNLMTFDTPFRTLTQVTENVGLCSDTVILLTVNKQTTDTV